MRTTKLTATRANGQVATGEFKCDQCDRSFPKAQGLSMHKTRAHLGIGPQKGDPRAGTDEQKPRRARKSSTVEMHFCPCCGLNLQAAAAGITVALRHSG